MPVSRSLYAILILGLLAVPAVSAAAADAPHMACLSKAEQRAAVASHAAIPLARALKAPREHGRHAEAVRARLCRNGDRLVYVLTLLGRSGKVFTATVDAASGEPVSVR
jgi:uncharacterized membrane protein YkoI